MGKAEAREGQTLEFKRQWTERALEDLAAFANTEGGRLLLGVRDDGEIVGTRADDRELQRIANLIAAHLGITPSVRVVEMQGLPVVEIRVDPAPGLVPYKGRYLRRVGSTNRDFSPEELARHILTRSGRSWDGLPSDWTLKEVDPEALKAFARLARERLPHVDLSDPEGTLRNLNLVEGERLKNAGVLLFGKRPQRLFPQAQVRVGIFRGDEILDSHDFTGTLWEQLDGAMARFRQVLKVRFDVRVEEPSLEGLKREETWEYPLEALREAVANALVHRDYTYPADIQIRLEEDRLEVWSPGELPPPLTPDQLYQPHSSVLRNPLIAQAFYFAGIIERWGTGTTRIVRLCREQGLPEPEFANWQGGFRVTFLKDPYTPERLRKWGLNERQIKAVLYVKEHGAIGNKEYQMLTGITKATASRDLDDLVKRGIFVKIGATGRGTHYALKGSQAAQRAQKGLKKDSKGSKTGQRSNK
ncbi:AAA family ATPase [Thermus scotoductus]|uniref:AAA family ATPase n=1 Tax=Thermus scotoductus TaxID=37636 RepID=A0A430UDI8_THESC|nr:helix-turn-helix domain-containing protein [Thermus scotoductus]RTH96322.1 AAA family ATPase [Thermus scotoductus]